MSQVGVLDARDNLSQLIRRAGQGEEIIITSHGMPKVSSRLVDRAEAVFMTSPLVRLKCLVAPLRAHDDDLVKRHTTTLDGFKQLPITAPTFSRATNIRADHGLKTPDAIDLTTAETGG